MARPLADAIASAHANVVAQRAAILALTPSVSPGALKTSLELTFDHLDIAVQMLEDAKEYAEAP